MSRLAAGYTTGSLYNITLFIRFQLQLISLSSADGNHSPAETKMWQEISHCGAGVTLGDAGAALGRRWCGVVTLGSLMASHALAFYSKVGR